MNATTANATKSSDLFDRISTAVISVLVGIPLAYAVAAIIGAYLRVGKL